MANSEGQNIPWLIGGSADLAPSTKTRLTFEGAGDFGADNYAGRNFHFGIREHAMGAVLNGLSLSKVRPYGSGFLIFSDYGKPAIRLAALMEIPVIYVFTHDSIGVGEDGHVASVFPEHPVAYEARSVSAVRGSPKPPPTRITLTLPALNSAEEVWLIAAGAAKASAVGMALAGGGPVQVPACGVHGVERTFWLLDRAAAGDLAALRPSSTFEKQAASRIIKKLAADAAVTLGDLDLDRIAAADLVGRADDRVACTHDRVPPHERRARRERAQPAGGTLEGVPLALERDTGRTSQPLVEEPKALRLAVDRAARTAAEAAAGAIEPLEQLGCVRNIERVARMPRFRFSKMPTLIRDITERKRAATALTKFRLKPRG